MTLKELLGYITILAIIFAVLRRPIAMLIDSWEMMLAGLYPILWLTKLDWILPEKTTWALDTCMTSVSSGWSTADNIAFVVGIVFGFFLHVFLLGFFCRVIRIVSEWSKG